MTNKTKETLIRKYGSEEAYREHMRWVRSQLKVHPRGGSFNDKEFARLAGSKGGKLSKRGKADNDRTN